MDRVQQHVVILGVHTQSKVPQEVRKRIGSGRLKARDAEDAAQYAYLRLCKELRRYDPARGAVEALVNVVAETAFEMFARDLRAQKRAPGSTPRSLDDRGPRGTKQPARNQLSLVDYGRRLGVGPGASGEDMLALREAAASLPEGYWEAVRLRFEIGEERAAEQLGIARRQLRKRVAAAMAHFKRHFGVEQ